MVRGWGGSLAATRCAARQSHGIVRASLETRRVRIISVRDPRFKLGAAQRCNQAGGEWYGSGQSTHSTLTARTVHAVIPWMGATCVLTLHGAQVVDPAVGGSSRQSPGTRHGSSTECGEGSRAVLSSSDSQTARAPACEDTVPTPQGAQVLFGSCR